MAVASLVCGILGILSIFFCWSPVFSIILLIASVVGIVLGIMSRKQLMSMGQPAGIATAGFILSIIGTVFSGIFSICSVCVCISYASALSELSALW